MTSPASLLLPHMPGFSSDEETPPSNVPSAAVGRALVCDVVNAKCFVSGSSAAATVVVVLGAIIGLVFGLYQFYVIKV